MWSNLFVSILLSHDVAFFDSEVHVIKAYTTHRTHFPAIWLIMAKCGHWCIHPFRFLSVDFFILIDENLKKLTSAPFPWIFRAGTFFIRYLKRIEKLNQAFKLFTLLLRHATLHSQSVERVIYYYSHIKQLIAWFVAISVIQNSK